MTVSHISIINRRFSDFNGNDTIREKIGGCARHAKAAQLETEDSGCRNAVRHVFWRGKPDFPGSSRSACRSECDICHDRLHHYGCWYPDPGRRSHRQHPFRRPAVAGQQSWQALWVPVYLPAVSDHRAVLRHSQMRDHILYNGNSAHAGRRRSGSAGAADFLSDLFCPGSAVLPSPCKHHGLDWKDYQPPVFDFLRDSGHFSPVQSRRTCFYSRAGQHLSERRFVFRPDRRLRHHGRHRRPRLWDCRH